MIRSYKELLVWQKAMDLSIEIYNIARKFPPQKIYGLSSQIKRAVLSVPSNIAEGRGRGTRKDFGHFLHISLGSISEVETQLIIAERLGFARSNDTERALGLCEEIKKMLNSIIRKLSGEKL